MVSTPGRDEEGSENSTRSVHELNQIMKQNAKHQRELMKKVGQVNNVLSGNEFSQKMKHLDKQMKALGGGVTATKQFSEQMKAFEQNEMEQLKAVVKAINTTDLGEHLAPLYDTQLDGVSAIFEAMATSGPHTSQAVSEAIAPPSPNISLDDIQTAPRKKGVSDSSSDKLVEELIDRGELIYCAECETVYARGNVQFVPTGENSSSEHDVICENCYGSDIGFQ